MSATRKLKHSLNEFLGRRGWEIQKKQPHLIDFIRSREITTILDVGANQGQYATGLRVRGYSNAIVSFEPDPDAFRILEAAASQDSLWTAQNLALGDRDEAGRAFNVTSYSEFNSFLSPTGALKEIDGRAAVATQTSVTVRRLDSIFGEYKGDSVFLKSDTQGYEKLVLLGAEQSLPKLRAVQLEVGFLEMYEGQPSFVELLELMRAQQFSLAMVWPNHYHPEDPTRMIEVDCIFANDRF
jgi:FkbM family methyltransferase